MSRVRAVAAAVVVAALVLTAWATLNGYWPGDLAGATRMTSTRDTGLISVALGLGALLPLKHLRFLLLAGAVTFLLLSLLFWIGVVGGR